MIKSGDALGGITNKQIIIMLKRLSIFTFNVINWKKIPRCSIENSIKLIKHFKNLLNDVMNNRHKAKKPYLGFIQHILVVSINSTYL